MTGQEDIIKFDYIAKAKERLIQQYKDKPKFNALLEGLADGSQLIEDEACNLFDIYDIDTMAGHNLDVIGAIVGQSRVLVDADELAFFGFDGASSAQTFGDADDSSLGGRFRSSEESTTGNVYLADPEYRLFIRARINKNYTQCTPEEIIAQVIFLINVDKVVFRDGDMMMNIGVGKLLDETEKFLLTEYDLIPRPVAVGLEYVYEFDGSFAFGFDGDLDSLGFDDAGSPGAGGTFASII